MCLGCIDETKYQSEMCVVFPLPILRVLSCHTHSLLPSIHSLWNPVIDTSHWTIASDGISVNGSLLPLTDTQMAVDTGYTCVVTSSSSLSLFGN